MDKQRGYDFLDKKLSDAQESFQLNRTWIGEVLCSDYQERAWERLLEITANLVATKAAYHAGYNAIYSIEDGESNE